MGLLAALHLITINHKSYAFVHLITLRLLNDNDSEVSIVNSSPCLRHPFHGLRRNTDSVIAIVRRTRE